MTGEPVPSAAIEPLHVELGDGTVVAAVVSGGSVPFTVVLLHDLGGDLDAVLPLLHDIGFAEARKVAVDLPGHGLSSGEADIDSCTASLGTWLRLLGERGWGPFLLVGVGRSAEIAWRIAGAAEVVGLCLVSPLLGAESLTPLRRALPMIGFLAEGSDRSAADWTAIRGVAQGPWTSASMMVTHERLAGLEDEVRGQVASHLTGFAREVYAQSR